MRVQNVSALAISTNEINVTWTEPLGRFFDGYEVEASFGGFVKIFNISDNSTLTTILDSLTPGTLYDIAVYALFRGVRGHMQSAFINSSATGKLVRIISWQMYLRSMFYFQRKLVRRCAVRKIIGRAMLTHTCHKVLS